MGKKKDKKKRAAKPKLTDEQKGAVEFAIKEAWAAQGWVLKACEWITDEGTYEVWGRGLIPGKHYTVGTQHQSIKGFGDEVFANI
jgi:hypothetical protein